MNNPRFWSIASTVGALLIAFLAVLTIKELKSIAYVGHDISVTDTVSVTGTGDATAVPDVATFSFGVTATAATVADAQTQATAKINSALKAVRDGGVADKDIQTQSYNINPHYEYSSSICTPNGCPPSKQTLTGYDVSEDIQVKVRDLTKAGTLFAAVGSAGVTDVNGLSFSVDKPDSVQAQARSAAIANAQSKANELAKELGVKLVRIVSFDESGNNPGPIMFNTKVMSAGMAVPAAAPEIPTGQQKITSNVTITYEIE